MSERNTSFAKPVTHKITPVFLHSLSSCFVSVCVWVSVWTHVYVCLYIYVCVCVCVCVCVHMHVCICVYVCICECMCWCDCTCPCQSHNHLVRVIAAVSCLLWFLCSCLALTILGFRPRNVCTGDFLVWADLKISLRKKPRRTRRLINTVGKSDLSIPWVNQMYQYRG